MPQLSITQTGFVRYRVNSLHLSADGRFVGLRRGRYVSLYDAAAGKFLLNFLLSSRYKRLTIAPNGMLLAAYTRNELVMIPAREQMRGGRVRRRLDDESCHSMAFTADGEHLWCAFQKLGHTGRLALLRSSTLEEVAAVPVPQGKIYSWSYTTPDWPEASLTLHPATDTLAVTRTAGDTFIGTFFFQRDGERIQQMPAYVDSAGDVNPPYHTFFSQDGTRFAAAESGLLWLWALPDMTLIGRDFHGSMPSLRSADGAAKEYAGEFAFIYPDYLVFAVVSEVFRKSIHVHELRVLDTRTREIVHTLPLPQSLGYDGWQFMHYNFCAMSGRTLVGTTQSGTFLYQLDLTL
ncbi:MAG: hypothetical protein SF029_07310 [bacterium]|nr:hypothetical protein [bacterium]